MEGVFFLEIWNHNMSNFVRRCPNGSLEVSQQLSNGELM